MNNLLFSLFARAGLKLQPNFGLPFVPRMGKVGISKEGLPRFYPGAKLARKAVQKAIGVKHPRGLRADGVTI